MNEYIYILSNPSMRGKVKVGKTTKHPSKRMSELRSTGVPTPFCLELSICVRDCHASERAAHLALNKYRVSEDREFFEISVKKAIQIILPVIGDHTIDDANSSFDIEEVKRWFVKKRIEEQRALNDKLWADYSDRSHERAQVISEINAQKNQLAKLGRRPKRDSLDGSLQWVWFVTAPIPFGWMFWIGIPGIFFEKMLPIGLFCSVVSFVGFLLNKQVSEYRDDFNSKNSEFARIDSLIDGLEKKLACLPELQKPSEQQFDERKGYEPWATPREVAANVAKGKELAKKLQEQRKAKKPSSDYKFSATEDFIKYNINSTYSENHISTNETPTWKTKKYRGKCSSCGTYFEVTLNSDERTAMCPKCFHSNSHETTESSIEDRSIIEESREKFWANALEMFDLNKILIDSPGTEPEERVLLQQQQESLERQIKREEDRGNPILVKLLEGRAKTKG